MMPFRSCARYRIQPGQLLCFVFVMRRHRDHRGIICTILELRNIYLPSILHTQFLHGFAQGTVGRYTTGYTDVLHLQFFGGFTQFIPSAVIRGMLAAIGIILIVKQIPLVVGYNQPDFWAKEIVNLFTFRHGFENISNLSQKLSLGTMLVSIGVVPVFFTWQRYGAKRFSFLPVSFMVVLVGVALAAGYNYLFAANPLTTDHYVSMPSNLFSGFMLPDWQLVIGNAAVWRTAVLICFVASLETLLSVEAIDKLDPYNRITPANRELVAQGIGNFASGLLGGLPITAVIVRSSANAQAGGRTRMSAFLHGIWLLIAVLFGAVIITVIPYCVLAVILIRTGYNLASPKMVRAVYKQGKEQFLPFLVTVVAVLFTDLLIGVLIGIVFAVYYLVVHTYRAGYTLVLEQRNGNAFYSIELALNVSFLNKKRIAEMLDTLPENAEVHINGAKSVYIDHDILEIFQDFKAKAKFKNILVATSNIPEVDTLEIH